MKEFEFDRDEHDVIGVLVGMGDDELEVGEWGIECDEFTLEHVDRPDAL